MDFRGRVTMKKIFKYILDGNPLTLPAGSKVISVKNQHDNIVLYAIVDTDIKDKMIYSIFITGTGQEIGKDLTDYTFLGTVALMCGDLMFHVFYKLDRYISA
jgi:hypothetical protein